MDTDKKTNPIMGYMHRSDPWETICKDCATPTEVTEARSKKWFELCDYSEMDNYPGDPGFECDRCLYRNFKPPFFLA
jgi:hypothetical protein